MTVVVKEDTRPGDIYISESGEVFEIMALCREPTATIENVNSGNKIGGASGCPNLEPYDPIESKTKEEIIESLRYLISAHKHLRADHDILKNELSEAKEEIANEKLKRLTQQETK